VEDLDQTGKNISVARLVGAYQMPLAMLRFTQQR